MKVFDTQNSNQKVSVVNISKVYTLIDWEIKVTKEEDLRKIIEWVENG